MTARSADQLTRIRASRWLAAAAAVILAATAVLHASGYTSVAAAIGASGLNPELGAALQAVWLMIALHLVILGVIVVVATANAGTAARRRVVLTCALLPAADTVVLLRFVGVFVGSIGLAAATILMIASVLVRPGATSRGDGA